MSFNINNYLHFIEDFQFFNSSLDSFIKNQVKNYFKYLSQDFDGNVLDLVQQKGFYPFEYVSSFEKFKEKFSSKDFKTKVELELISDADMYLFIEKGIRGGVSYIPKGYSQASNKYLKSYVPKQESKHIICLDANNLYGYALSNISILKT